MALGDLVLTIDSDTDDAAEFLQLKKSSSSKATIGTKNSRKASVKEDNATQHDGDTLDPDFTFDTGGDIYDEVLNGTDSLGDLVKGSKREPLSVDDIVARRKLSKKSRKRKLVEVDEEDDSLSEGLGHEVSGEDVSAGEESDDPLMTSDGDEDEDEVEVENESFSEDDNAPDEGSDAYPSSSESDTEEETQAEKERKAAFFAVPGEQSSLEIKEHTSFNSMSLSRPLLKALTGMGFSSPTPIQAATIPVALLGKDVVGNAVTGSGKTAAFIIPVLERLMYRERGKGKAAVRCVVLVPTRELGVQCADVAKKLAAYMDVRTSLIVGGLSLKSQEAELRTRPDILIATPGRLIDHLRNSPTFALDTLDVLILDEADRMLSDGFADELKEIISACPRSRQTMLFSATMTDDVDALVRMTLNKPVKLFVDPKRSTARGLLQEFVRVRAERESERAALLVALCQRTCKRGVIIFFRSKKLAHQLRVVFSILGLKAEELHGDLSQEQRLRALQLFRDGAVDFLMATDLASRGLDIKGIETVINYDMPGQLAQYLHRVGRTARAGKKGRSITLVGEADRKMLKSVIKHSSDADKVRHRTVPPEFVSMWSTKLSEIKEEISEVLKEEKEEKAIRQAEMELKKGENIIEHEKDIFSRPARTWFQSEKEKKNAKEVSKKLYESDVGLASSRKKDKEVADGKPKRDKFAGMSRRAKRRKLAMEEDADEGAAVRAAVRSAKKDARPKKIGIPDSDSRKSGKSKGREKRRSTSKLVGKKDVSGQEVGEKRKRGSSVGAKEGIRAQKSDKIKGMGKKGAGKKGAVKRRRRH